MEHVLLFIHEVKAKLVIFNYNILNTCYILDHSIDVKFN